LSITADQIFWGIALILISAAAGVGGKIFYDMLRFKAPPRDEFDKKRFSEEYDADLCALRHNELDKDVSGLRNEDIKMVTCLNHMKTKLHGLEIIATEHHQKLETDDRRIISLEKNTQEIKKDYSEIRKDYSTIKNGIDKLLER
jgi:hypothetical protein